MPLTIWFWAFFVGGYCNVCIFILGFMALLLYHLQGSIARLQLSEQVGGLLLPLAEGWEVLLALWPVMLFMFLAGVVTLLLVMKLWGSKRAPKSS